MTLRSVSVPPEMAQAFARAEEVVSRFFAEWRAAPERGTIEIFGERYVLVRAASLSVEFFEMVRELYGPEREEEAATFARNILFDLAHAIGKSDAQNFHSKMALEDPISRLSAGPIHFAHSGWAFVEIHPESSPTPDEDFCLVYDHPYSFESDAWLRTGHRREFPVCIMNAGYSSGWCEESFGVELVASELLCRARGNEHCRFLMAHPRRIEELVKTYLARRQDEPEAPPEQSYEIPDFFARKRAEEELRRSYAELEERVEARTKELRAANERLQREIEEREEVEHRLRQAHKLEAVGRLAGGIAHDFNNLMNTVILRAGFLERRIASDEEALDELRYILGAAKRAAGLTRQLLTFSRAQTAQVESIDLSALISDLGETVLPLLGEDIALEVRVDDREAVIEADGNQIEQVVMNLAVNARDAMPNGGRLTIAAGREEVRRPFATAIGELAPGAYACLTVRDTGTGIDEQTLARMFEPFFTTKPGSHGSGLGLATVYGVVKESGGGLTVDSEIGRGTTFLIYFPLSHRPRRASPARTKEQDPAGEGRLLLLVEDQEDLRASLQKQIEQWGFQVLAATSPAEALETAARVGGELALVVSDVVMPGMDGRELARRIWSVAPSVPVVFMSGYAPGEESSYSDERIAGLLQKPITSDALARAVSRALEVSG